MELNSSAAGPQRDELELARPHVARGEGARVACARKSSRVPARRGSVAPPAVASPPRSPRRAARRARGWPRAIAGLLFAGAGPREVGGVRAGVRGARSRGARARRAAVVRAGVAGGRGAPGGIAAEGAGAPAWGALGVALAMVLATSRAPAPTRAARGPGQWLAYSPAEAFPRGGEGDLLNLASWSGKATLLLAALGSVAVGLALLPVNPSWAWLVPLDALPLLPLLATGSRAQLPPDRARSPRRRLASLHRALAGDRSLRVAPWARVPAGAAAPDELRLLVLPRAAMPGVLGIEVGVA